MALQEEIEAQNEKINSCYRELVYCKRLYTKLLWFIVVKILNLFAENFRRK